MAICLHNEKVLDQDGQVSQNSLDFDKVNGRKGYMALKLDMSKTYDHIEWEFIDVVMTRLAFPLIGLVWLCNVILHPLSNYW